MKLGRAPRSKKRISCDLTIDGNHYKGIVLDVSASGLFVQTTVKPFGGAHVSVALRLPGVEGQVVVDGRVARKKAVPAVLLTAAGGGVGIAIDKPPKAYLDFIAQMSPEQAQFVADSAGSLRRSTGASPRGGSGGNARTGAVKKSSGGARFRVHAVESASGRKNSYLVACESEAVASAQVLEQLGAEWQVIFIERA